LRGRGGLRPRRLRGVGARPARPRGLSAAVAVRGVVPLAGPLLRARRAHRRGRGGRVRRAGRVSALQELDALLRAEGGLIARQTTADLATAAPFADDVATESVREGYLL